MADSVGPSKKRKKKRLLANTPISPTPLPLEQKVRSDSSDKAHLPRKKKRRKLRAPGAAEATPVAATAPPAPRGKKRKKSADAATKEDAAASNGVSAEIVQLMHELRDPNGWGTLSDRLNSTHRYFDASLKKRWKLFSKKERRLVVDCDKSKVAEAFQATAGIKHPFEANTDDHCETAVEAYRDISPILSLLARTLGKKPAALKIYDPFFCAGAVVGHLGELGFQHVYNKCEDFYEVVKEGRVPPHDVVVTNPPYSGDHVDKLLRWCRSNGKPFLLLMPNYFSTKSYYKDALGGADGAASMLYLFPWKRYVYWTPKGLRGKDKVQGHVGAGGNRTSPFVSFWYLDVAPVVTPRNLLKWWAAGAGGSPAARVARVCKFDKLPEGVYPDKFSEQGQEQEQEKGAASAGADRASRLEEARARLMAQRAK